MWLALHGGYAEVNHGYNYVCGLRDVLSRCRLILGDVVAQLGMKKVRASERVVHPLLHFIRVYVLSCYV